LTRYLTKGKRKRMLENLIFDIKVVGIIFIILILFTFVIKAIYYFIKGLIWLLFYD